HRNRSTSNAGSDPSRIVPVLARMPGFPGRQLGVAASAECPPGSKSDDRGEERDEEGRARLVPALILYHPSRTAVFRALNILAKSGRVDFLPIADRLFDSPDAEIRAAALRARSTVQPDAVVLGRAAEDPNPLVRATGIVGL